MREAEIVERFRLLQREVELAGEAVSDLQRDHRAEIDAVRLEVEVLRRCLLLMHPTLEEQWHKVRAQVVQETDPETT
jgi:hypothetical protein